MSLRNLFWASLAVPILLGGFASPSFGAQSVNNMYRASNGEIIALEVRVNTTGTMAFAVFAKPISDDMPRGSWSYCLAPYSSGQFTCTETTPEGGQVIGQEYRAPTKFTAGRKITVNVNTLTMATSTENLTLAPIELVSGGLNAEILANMPATGIYVPRVKTDDAPTFGSYLSGTGAFLTSQKNHASVLYLTYASDGAPIWYLMTGPVVASANIVTLSGDFNLAGDEASIGTATLQSRNNGGHRFDAPGVISTPTNEHWVSPLRSETF